MGSNLASNIPRFPLLNSLAGSLTSELRSLKEKLKGPEREERRSSPAEEVVEAILGLDYSRSAQTSPEVSPAEARNLLDSEFKTRMDRGWTGFHPIDKVESDCPGNHLIPTTHPPT